jgi:hypothetical protein
MYRPEFTHGNKVASTTPHGLSVVSGISVHENASFATAPHSHEIKNYG